MLATEVAQFLVLSPQIRPSPANTIPPTTKKVDDTSAKSSDAKSKEENVVPPTVVPAGTSEEKPVANDPLGDARSKVQEKIGKEFAAIMASGTLCASEAAALATKLIQVLCFFCYVIYCTAQLN
ncbi:PPPDE putative thiol peptidase family protein [Artemisia annua]|uniref:PPPDE putative thiol peptidase family protein n=1 Tax=Artemisia annua TaxID=35608 RepID=A0A2U1PMV5_ARTAN|nr:PPPDE putative thiol peptidase family protein [Artemisia annua]